MYLVRERLEAMKLNSGDKNSKEQGLVPIALSLMLRYDTIGRIELIPSIVLSSDNTNYKNIIQLFLQLFDELSVYRDYH